MSLGAGAGAVGFVASDFGPDLFGGDLLVAIEWISRIRKFLRWGYRLLHNPSLLQVHQCELLPLA